MVETEPINAVAIAIITASAGFGGALVGALAAVLGPWWLRRADRIAADRATSLEARRIALVRWIDANIRLTNAKENHAPPDQLGLIAIEANSGLTELLSRLPDPVVHNWISDISMFVEAPELSYFGRRQYQGAAGRMLLEWHQDNRSTLTPFIVHYGAEKLVRMRDEWPTPAEAMKMLPKDAPQGR